MLALDETLDYDISKVPKICMDTQICIHIICMHEILIKIFQMHAYLQEE